MSTNRYLVVHGHFYQPPRENPWIESVEVQDSAAPYHDWNARITAECYARNGASRIVNKENQILRIVNNYAQISFNFGPTLLSWLEENAAVTYRSILEADRISAERFSTHGSAMAQVYNHVIMPLASRRDKELQVRWGLADFERRFGRKPEGMWLAETAVDTETLEVLAAHGILFTVLAPSQCMAVRPLSAAREESTEGEELTATAGLPVGWVATPDASVDTRRPYRVRLTNGRSIAVFFYDGPRSRAIAFERLLNSGEGYALRMASGFSAERPREPELVHVATDGESYGHHHRFGEMGLSYALQYTEEHGLATLTNYGEFLARFPPREEARIAERTSWSCAHGVERWRSDCGCGGGKPGWNQRWRGPLRAALDELRDALTNVAVPLGAELFKDWDRACDRYIEVILDRAPADAFLRSEQARPLNPAEEASAWKLLELLRHAQLMYTSCGWFFDDIAGIETVQIIAYAARALELAADLFGAAAGALETRFIERLGHAHSNVAAEGTGADIYRNRVKPLQVGLAEVAAHYAISSVFRDYPERARVLAFEIHRESAELYSSGRARLVWGAARVVSTLTHESERFFYAVFHFGDQNIAAGVKRAPPDEAAAASLRKAMLAADLPAVVRRLDREFGRLHTIHSLFTDEQRRTVALILDNTVARAEGNLIRLYNDHASLLHFLSEAKMPQPPALALAAGFAVNRMLRRALESEVPDAAQVRDALALAEQQATALNREELAFVSGERMREAMQALAAEPENREASERAGATAEVLRLLPFDANIWEAQNIWYALASGKTALGRSARFEALGRALRIAVP